jgi:DNA-binding Xre family transcriptional regulator
MKWNLRLTAANHGIWKASELQRMLADAGLVISAGKMSGLWSGSPASIKLEDLDVICAVLGCQVQDLLIPETVQPAAVLSQDEQADVSQPAVSQQTGRPRPAITPRRRDHRSLPPA